MSLCHPVVLRSKTNPMPSCANLFKYHSMILSPISAVQTSNPPSSTEHWVKVRLSGFPVQASDQVKKLFKPFASVRVCGTDASLLWTVLFLFSLKLCSVVPFPLCAPMSPGLIRLLSPRRRCFREDVVLFPSLFPFSSRIAATRTREVKIQLHWIWSNVDERRWEKT